MIKTIVSDFSRVLLFPANEGYSNGLNDLYRKISEESDYDFFAHFRLNDELLMFFKSLKGQYSLNIFTSEIIQDDKAVKPLLESIFTHIFSAKQLGVMKTQKEAYFKIAEQLQEEPASILYIDDKLANLQAASDAGFKTIQYVSNPQIIKNIKEAIR